MCVCVCVCVCGFKHRPMSSLPIIVTVQGGFGDVLCYICHYLFLIYSSFGASKRHVCRPDVATDQNQHCLSIILSQITLNGVKADQML